MNTYVVLRINTDTSDMVHTNCTIASFFMLLICFSPEVLQALSR